MNAYSLVDKVGSRKDFPVKRPERVVHEACMETIGITAPIYRSAAIAARSQTRLLLHETTRASVADVELPHFLTVFVAGPTVPAKRLPRDWRSDAPDIDPVYFS